MKKYFASCLILALGLSLVACQDDDSNDTSIIITPEEAVSLSENGGEQDYYVMLDGAHSLPVQVVIGNSDPAHLSLDKTLVTFPKSKKADSVIESFKAKCIDDNVKDGNHTIKLHLTAVGLGANQQWERIITCNDDDTQTEPVAKCEHHVCSGDMIQVCNKSGVLQDPISCADGLKCSMENGEGACVSAVNPDPERVCSAGQIFCADAQNYKSCNVAENAWTTTTTACPADKPVCNTMTNQCEASSEPPVVTCQAVCNGDLIRRCENNELMAPSYCDAGKACRTTNGISECVVTKVIPDDGYIEVSKFELTIYEGGSSTFTVVPATEPTATVNVMMSVTDSTEGVLETTAVSFTKQDWRNPKTVRISAPRDGEVDGSQKFQITFKVVSSDNAFDGKSVKPIEVTTVDTESDECAYNGSKNLAIRAMAANITSGSNSNYSDGPGIRIFQAMKPDIVMIQEFNWSRKADSDSYAFKLIQEAFDMSYYVHRGGGEIPNGIISRFPIIESGSWDTKYAPDRDWEWSLIDLPGRKELLVISVHLKTDDNKAEANSMMNIVNKKVTTDRSNGLEYYMMIGGDFNNDFQKNGALKDLFSVYTELPEDQNGETATNASRKSVLDHVFVDKSFEKFEVPVEIGKNSYDHGHVFDSRVYQKKGELADVAPVRGDDCGATNMQHMAVIRDFEFSLN